MSDRLLARFKNTNLIVMGMFVTFVVAKYMEWGARRAIFETIRIEFSLGAMLFTVGVVYVLMKRVDIESARKVLVAVALLFVASAIQVPFAADPGLASRIFYNRLVKFFMLSFFMLVFIRSPRDLRWFMFAFLFACFYVTQESVRGLIRGSLIWENQGVMRLHGAVPIYTHPNSLAGVSMGAIVFVVFLLPAVRDWRARAGLAALLGTAATCVIYSGSRTGYVALVGFLAYWWAVSPNKKRWLLIGGVLGAVSLSVIPSQYIGRFRSITGEEAEGHSREKRIEILRDAWVILQENPGGVGLGCFPVVRMQRFNRMQDTHNLYFEVATNTGVQGLLIFVIFLWILMQTFYRAGTSLARQRRKLIHLGRSRLLPAQAMGPARTHLQNIDYMIAACKAGAGFIIVRLLLGLFGMDFYEIYWWFSAGLAMALAGLDDISRRTTGDFVELAEENAPATGF